ncbi:hypothetical protein LCM08_13070 [Salipiger pacificus]|nr:hypothetical protein [Alloyangia pacifica]
MLNEMTPVQRRVVSCLVVLLCVVGAWSAVQVGEFLLAAAGATGAVYLIIDLGREFVSGRGHEQ